MNIGLTGGIAAGKSTVRDLLASRSDAEIFDADACVHRLLASDSRVASEIRRSFGSRFLSPEGTPDRAALREAVFHSPESRHRLEEILHPLVRAEWLERREQCAREHRHFLAEIPLLCETGSERFFDAIVVAACLPATQIARVEKRGVPPTTARAMLASQLPMEQKISAADFVVWTEGSLSSVERQVATAVEQFFPS